jgi:hypothetical protein
MVELSDGTGFFAWRRGFGERLRLARPNGEEVAGKIVATEQLLSELRLRRTALLAAIAAADQEEESYAAEGRDYTDLQRLRSKRGRLDWDLRQLDEQPLLAQLAVLRSEQRRQHLEEFQSTQREEIEAGLSLVQQGFDCFDRARKIWERASGEGFATQMITIPDVWARDILARVRSQLAGEAPQPPAPAHKLFDAEGAWRRTISRAALGPSGPERSRTGELVVAHGASGFTTDPAPRQPARAPYNDAAQPGQRRIVILHSGYESPDGRQCRAGDVVAVDAGLAQRVVANGAAHFAPEEVVS